MEGQQWAAQLPQDFVFPRKTPAAPYIYHARLHPRLFETAGIMAGPDCSGIFKIEDDAVFDNATAYGMLNTGDIFPSEQHTIWDFQSTQQAEQPALSTNWPGHGMGEMQAPRQRSVASQSSRASYSNAANNGQTSAWQPAMAANAPITAPQSSLACDSQPVSYAQYQTVPTLATDTSYSLQPYTKNTSDSPMVAPRTLHDGSWDIFNPMNQYPNVPGQVHFSTGFHGLPFGPKDQISSSQVPSSRVPSSQVCQAGNDFRQDSYCMSLSWAEWQAYGSNGFSSESDVASPVSPAGPADPNASFGGQSFCSSVNSKTTPLPALTFSQTSPASEWDEVPSSYPGENQEQAEGPRRQTDRFRTLLVHDSGLDTWTPSKDDAYTTVNGKMVKKDDLLVQWKQAGMSYRQIKEKGGFSEAESTLRGRFRTLTKDREQRVRKPHWLARDIRLLREGIKEYMLGSLYPGVDAARMEVDAMDVDTNKVPWKKVAEYIRDHGGSYHFGNATCKKQWLKIQGRL